MTSGVAVHVEHEFWPRLQGLHQSCCSIGNLMSYFSFISKYSAACPPVCFTTSIHAPFLWIHFSGKRLLLMIRLRHWPRPFIINYREQYRVQSSHLNNSENCWYIHRRFLMCSTRKSRYFRTQCFKRIMGKNWRNRWALAYLGRAWASPTWMIIRFNVTTSRGNCPIAPYLCIWSMGLSLTAC